MDGTTLQIERLDGSLLRIDGLGLARRFFTSDRSSVGASSYDQLAGRTEPNRITHADIKTLNRTMRARSKHDRWAELLTDTELPWLADLSPELDLITTDAPTWEATQAQQLITNAVAQTVSSGRGPSVATKMLHLKRPRLFPILDNLVAQTLGTTPFTGRPAAQQASQAALLLAHLREQGQANRTALETIQTTLEREHIDRSLVRILDVSIWSSHPAAAAPGRRIFVTSVA